MQIFLFLGYLGSSTTASRSNFYALASSPAPGSKETPYAHIERMYKPHHDKIVPIVWASCAGNVDVTVGDVDFSSPGELASCMIQASLALTGYIPRICRTTSQDQENYLPYSIIETYPLISSISFALHIESALLCCRLSLLLTKPPQAPHGYLLQSCKWIIRGYKLHCLGIRNLWNEAAIITFSSHTGWRLLGVENARTVGNV